MLRYLPHHEINEKSWNDCVEASAERIVYAFSWYLNTVCKRWDAVVEEKDGKYVSVFPLPLGRRHGQLGILQPYFTQQLGLFSTPQSKYKSINDYLQLIPAKYKSVYLQLNSSNTEGINQHPVPLKVAARTNYLLSLAPPYEELLKNYRNRHKLNKAKRQSIKVAPLSTIHTLINLFRSTKGKELTEIKSQHYKLLERLYEVLKERKQAELWQVVNAAGEAIAAAFFILEPGRIIFLLSGASEEGRRTAAMTLLLDSMIQRFAGSNRILDFEGSMVPSVGKFYANFGAGPVTYLSLTRQHTPWYLIWKEAISTS
ncbi:GNAT family N-acetyltransferase [uncultured Pontibacter sp.]|uniref:GNAT family N-acetyltransferase n=1 Tax=uncultured Pontibacter sp. TaxID=453356 RepID=UPI00263643CC|nr:GNAT family N-acetyltransferase [uncultured Pontibacter sp.]